MGTIPQLRQIKPEDFDSKDQKLVQKLAFPFNNFMQQVVTAFSNNIDFNNLNQQLVTFTVTVDSTGAPTVPVQFTNNLKTKVIGIICINAANQSSTIRYPTSTPFISYTTNAKLVTITNIAGLGIPSGQTNSDSYTLTILTVGDNVPTA